MSSRRKSTTPCMVLPSNVVEQEELEEKTDRTKKEEEVEREEGKMKRGAEEGPSAEELEQAVVVVPTPPDTDEPTVSTADDSEVPGPSVKGSSLNLAEDPNSNQSNPEQQSDVVEEGVSVAAISLSKTPIMRMKTKSEPKRIAVSLKSTEEAADSLGGGGGSSGGGGGGGGEGDVGGEQEPIEAPLGPMNPVEMLLHDSMKLGGGGLHVSPSSEQQRKTSILNPTVLPTSLAQVLSAFQAQQTAAAAQSQLLIPLSSIPSYNAAMDSNPLLGSTYKKFPYPSLAEISSLATQTQFTEEQIKVWFSAQRLKHGVSWTPEEVEDARRKQFNGTVHTVPQTITVIPAHQLSAAANGLQSILQTCQIVGQSGLVFTQENSALSADTFSMRPKKSKEQLAELKASYLKNHFVTDAEIARLMKVTNLTKGEIKKWFSDTRYNQRNSKNSHVIVFHEGGGRGGGSCSSSASATIVIDSSDDNPTSPHPPCTPPVKEKETRPKTWNPFPDFTLQKFKEKTPEQLVLLEESFEKNSSPSDEELSRLRTETKLTRREIDAWFTERRKVPHVSTSSPDSSDGGKVETDGEKAVDKEEAGGANASNNLASSSCKGNQTPPGGRSKQHPSTSSKKDFKDKSKKTPEQLHILKSAFVRTQWPTPEEYDQLSGESGLPRSYIVSWFGDSRYSWKNGNLKWFFQYQSGNIEGANTGGGTKMGSGGGRKRRGRNRGWGRSRTRKQPRRSVSGADADRAPPAKKFKTGREILKEYYLRYSFLNEQDLDELVTKTNMSYEQVREWFSEVQRRLDMGLDPFQEPSAGCSNSGEKGDREEENGGESRGGGSRATEDQAVADMGDEDGEDDEDDEDDADDTDDSEVWEPSRSVKKSLSVSED
ncbi:zinc fingers and homeoboxes protein 1 isoform X3 [Cynoglossus semilaevis]|uniref:zinc fingers and homeoboxes protein 1 isoform X3 n=1 Tax=Cynoglossus semilaevis TaxID=244447 RepID=UPI0007DC910C|nr:zinc fingers and homeoboxes protein 1 isoform X3 [Cynoglossus semilaevis]